jgi:hypothetical protein
MLRRAKPERNFKFVVQLDSTFVSFTVSTLVGKGAAFDGLLALLKTFDNGMRCEESIEQELNLLLEQKEKGEWRIGQHRKINVTRKGDSIDTTHISRGMAKGTTAEFIWTEDKSNNHAVK